MGNETFYWDGLTSPWGNGKQVFCSDSLVSALSSTDRFLSQSFRASVAVTFSRSSRFSPRPPRSIDLGDVGLGKKCLAALTRSHLIGDHPSGLTKEQTETMDPSPKTKGLRP